MEIEEWRDIPDLEGLYQVSSLGRIRSLPRYHCKGQILKPFKDKDGYECITVTTRRREKMYNRYKVHRLVAQVFVENKYNKKTVNHIDGVKDNNIISNLEWSTSKEQAANMRARGTLRYGESNNLCRTKKEDILKAISLYNNRMTVVMVSKLTRIPVSTLYPLFQKVTWPKLWHLYLSGKERKQNA